MNPTGTYSHLFGRNHREVREELRFGYGFLTMNVREWLTSAPSPNRAPSQNRVLALWNTAALLHTTSQIEKQCEKLSYMCF